MSDQALRDVMLTKVGGVFSFLGDDTFRADAFQRDVLLIQGAYYDRGYVNAVLGEPVFELSRDRKAVHIRVPITEGQKYRLGKVEVVGDLLGRREDVLALLSLRSGDVFNRSQVGKNVDAISTFFKDAGYPYANPTPVTTPDPDRKIVDLKIEVQAGERVFIERINISGNRRTRDRVIRREMRLSEGDAFSQSAIDEIPAPYFAAGILRSG